MTIGGMAGVGKTALALHWAHQVKDQFPDGQFFVNMRGYSADGRSVAPSEVLERWLRQLEPDAPLPDTLDALSAMFRDILATRRVLLVLDNVSGEEQVRPLLPSVGASVAIVTSRDALDGLAGIEVTTAESLSELTPQDSQRMLTAIIGQPAIDSPESIARLARYCAHLPLALRVAAGSIVTKSRRGYPLKTLIAAFEIEEHRLSRLGSGSGDSRSDVRVAFSYSYQALDATARRAFRLLGLHLAAGSTIDAYVMGALLDKPSAEAATILERLEHRGLVAVVVNEAAQSTEPELRYLAYRYRVHDLLRLYAGELILRRRHRRERIAALQRLTEAYHGCVNYAFTMQNKKNPMVDIEYVEKWCADPAGRASVDLAGSPTEWFDRERPNLLGAVHAAAAARPRPRYTAKLACSLFYFLEIGGHLSDWAAVEEVGAEAATASGDRHDRARSLRNRGRFALVKVLDTQDRLRDDRVAHSVDRTPCREAIALLESSLDLYRKEHRQRGLRRDQAGEVTVLRELGDSYRLKVDPAAPHPALIAAAIEKYDEAADIYATLDNENGLNSLRLALGIAYVLEDPEDRSGKAEELFTQSHRYGTMIDSGRAQHGRLAAYSLIHLGELRHQQGRQDEAIQCYREAVAMLRAHVPHDHVRRARALALLAQALAESGARHEAGVHFHEALTMFAARGRSHEDEASVVTLWLARHGIDDQRNA
nr:NB-ARC domain-containing protein [Amycolatopsis umgeniensis]